MITLRPRLFAAALLVVVDHLDGVGCMTKGRRCRRRRRGGILLVLLGVVALSGCTPVAPPPAVSTRAASPPAAETVAGFLIELAAARWDPERWARLTDPTDPGFAAEAERVRANLAQFRVEFVAAGQTHELTEARMHQLGTSARAHAVRVRWAVPGEPVPAEHVVWLTLTNSAAGARLAGIGDGPRERIARPIWWERPVAVHHAAGVAVITGSDTDLDSWLTGLTEARATLAGHSLQPPLVVAEIPASAAAFEQVLGVRPGSHRQVAATAWPHGPAVRIVVNPETVPEHGAARQVLLTHEAVHVATGSVGSPVPLWLAEGYADLIALSDQPEVAAAHLDQLAADQRQHGIAPALVTAAELAPAHPRVHANYQRSWLTVTVLDRDRGSAGRVQAAVGAGVPLDQALAAEDWTEADLTAAVHAELLRLVGR